MVFTPLLLVLPVLVLHLREQEVELVVIPL
jgi:hypothetical protein